MDTKKTDGQTAIAIYKAKRLDISPQSGTWVEGYYLFVEGVHYILPVGTDWGLINLKKRKVDPSTVVAI